MKKTSYSQPEVEVVNVQVEKGFATSGGHYDGYEEGAIGGRLPDITPEPA